jgi:hypothetical protein
MKIKSFLASFLAVFMLSMSGAWADSVVNPIDQALENKGYLIKVYSAAYECQRQCETSHAVCQNSCRLIPYNSPAVEECNKNCDRERDQCAVECGR